MKVNASISHSFAAAISQLLFPFAEVVIHDFKKDRILKIYNSISKRKVGDRSYIDLPEIDCGEDVIGPYEKLNWDGRRLKSITIVERDDRSRPRQLICINFDISKIEQPLLLLSQFINFDYKVTEKLKPFFDDNPYEKINNFITHHLQENNRSIDSLSKEEKQKLILLLNEKGAFEKKNAASYIGRVLGVSRATVYNYLKEGL